MFSTSFPVQEVHVQREYINWRCLERNTVLVGFGGLLFTLTTARHVGTEFITAEFRTDRHERD